MSDDPLPIRGHIQAADITITLHHEGALLGLVLPASRTCSIPYQEGLFRGPTPLKTPPLLKTPG